MHTDVSVSTVHNVISLYNRFGPKVIEGREYGIRRRCYLTRDQEALFLKPFLEIAPTGEICVAGRIKQALEELLGHEVHHSTVYRMLHRNGWLEIVPRPAHPEGKEQKREALKNFPELVGEIVEQRDPEDTRPVILRARAGITWSSERDEAPAWQGASEQPPEHTRRYVRRQHSEQRRQAGASSLAAIKLFLHGPLWPKMRGALDASPIFGDVGHPKGSDPKSPSK